MDNTPRNDLISQIARLETDYGLEPTTQDIHHTTSIYDIHRRLAHVLDQTNRIDKEQEALIAQHLDTLQQEVQELQQEVRALRQEAELDALSAESELREALAQRFNRFAGLIQSDDDENEDFFLYDGGTGPDRVERILAEAAIPQDRESVRAIYLVKWQDRPLVNSSWEKKSAFVRDSKNAPFLEEWLKEKQRISEGRSQAFDIVKFRRLVDYTDNQTKLKNRLKAHHKGLDQALQRFRTATC